MELRWYQEEAVEAMIRCTDNGVVVLPTGSGKTLVMQEYIRRTGYSILLLSHVKEILEQNFECVAPLGNVGVYSAGLEIKLIDHITIAGIQSVYKTPELFKNFDVVLIDECDLISDEGMYHTFLDQLGIPYIGLTATPYRLKSGYIYKSGLFDSLIYEAPIRKLQDQGYLTKIDMVGSVNEMDTKGLATTGGDFNIKEASLRFDREAITNQIMDGLVVYKNTYKHWLLFCIDIKHAEHVSEALNQRGITCAAVHSQSPRDEALQAFKSGEIQAVANVNVLTVGFDYPEIDLIAIVRPTKSTRLHVQMIGRGLRVAEGKTHCLVKDFAGNTGRLGFIDDLAPLEKTKKKGKGGVNPFAKTCPECEKINAPAVRICECGYEFKFEHHLSAESHSPPKWYNVSNVYFSIYKKPGKPDSLKITYQCGLKRFNQWIHLDHGGYAGYKARYWVSKRWIGMSNLLPKNVK
jgi:DNA repair protein RadD